jgi:hypothetical protein
LSNYENYDEMVEEGAALIYELQQLNSKLQVELNKLANGRGDNGRGDRVFRKDPPKT